MLAGRCLPVLLPEFIVENGAESEGTLRIGGKWMGRNEVGETQNLNPYL
jgi:hypothetical protein